MVFSLVDSMVRVLVLEVAGSYTYERLLLYRRFGTFQQGAEDHVGFNQEIGMK